MTKYNWSEWMNFPNPSKCEYLYAPIGIGVYQIRNKATNEFVLFGSSKNVAFRITSLLSKDYGGSGNRKNQAKSAYVSQNIENIQYRTIALSTIREALEIERALKKCRNHIINT